MSAKNILMAAAGASAGPVLGIEDVFSTYLYTGNGSTQTINNGIDLAGKGGLVWVKARSSAVNHGLSYKNNSTLFSNLTDAETGPGVTFNNNGFTTASNGTVSNVGSGVTHASWTFRKQPKFFDVVTYTGDGVAGRTVAHNLGSVPGCIITKRTDTTGNWITYHRSLGNTDFVNLNTTAATSADNGAWDNTTPTSSVFSLGSGNTNVNGATYVAYLFAHNAGGFGLTGTDNVISCGSFTTDGSGSATVNLGYEPQWLLIKRTDSTGAWYMWDTMRGLPVTASSSNRLSANTSAAEVTGAESIYPTATGFTETGQLNTNSTYIYIAIRRGPMRTPTEGTKVYKPITRTGGGSVISGVGFAPDMVFSKRRDGGRPAFYDKLRGVFLGLNSSATNTEWNDSDSLTGYTNDGINVGADGTMASLNYSGLPYNSHFFRRAPGFFDEVCYKGGASSSIYTQNHNLGVTPELMIVKRRDVSTANWIVWAGDITKSLILNSTAAVDSASGAAYWNSTNPTATQFSVGGNAAVNNSSSNYVAYLFASCPGVSKAGSYTGNGTTQQINCGFTAGARFVLIKRTDSTGDWYVWDSARGIVTGNDPYLLLNTTDAEVTGTDYIDPYSAGFEISSTAPAAINASGGNYIYLAIA